MSFYKRNKNMKEEKFVIRHGDVIVISTKETPQGKEKKDKALAYGEVTGHSHRMKGGDTQVFEWNEKMYLKVTKRSTLTHEEHGEIEIPVGDYEVIIQRDYVPGGWTKVID